jgi:hypothetical protein
MDESEMMQTCFGFDQPRIRPWLRNLLTRNIWLRVAGCSAVYEFDVDDLAVRRTEST